MALRRSPSDGEIPRHGYSTLGIQFEEMNDLNSALLRGVYPSNLDSLLVISTCCQFRALQSSFIK